jgi:hypothetical protein
MSRLTTQFLLSHERTGETSATTLLIVGGCGIYIDDFSSIKVGPMLIQQHLRKEVGFAPTKNAKLPSETGCLTAPPLLANDSWNQFLLNK